MPRGDRPIRDPWFSGNRMRYGWKFRIVGPLLIIVIMTPAIALPVVFNASLLWYGIWLGLACVPAGLAIAMFADKARADYVQKQSEREHRCPDCGYSLRGLKIPQCPECGVVFSPWNPDDHPAE